MSIIIQNKGEVTKSATNNSVSKFMYSFSKAPRFPSFKISGHTDAYYDIPVTRSTRATNFGFGNRSDFTMGKSSNKKNDKDDKNKTQIPTTNEEEKVKFHGPVYSFPKYDPTKKKIRKDANGNEIPQFKDPTGPGYYNILRPFGSDALKFTMKGRIDGKKDDKKNKDENEKKDSKQQEEESYSLKNKAGKYVLSNMINMPTFNFGDKNQVRFKYKFSDTPGPAPKLKEGEEEKPFFGRPHFNSKYRSNNGITISGRTKQIDSRSNYPGPGSYRLPSEWGQYQSKDADKYPTENVYPVKKIPFEEKAWRHNMKVVKEKSPEDEENYMEKEEVDIKEDQPKLGGDEEEKKEEGEEKKGDEQIEGYVDKEEEDKKVEEEPKTNEQGEENKKEGENQPQTETQKEDEKKEEEKKDETKKEGEEQVEGFVDNEENDKKVEGNEANPSAQKEEPKKEEEKKEEEPKKEEEKKDEPQKEEEKKEEGEMFIDNEEENKKVEGDEANPSAQKQTTNEQPANANEEKKDENANANGEKKDENSNANEEKKDENANANEEKKDEKNEEENKEEFFIEQEEKEENINNLNQ